MASQRDVTRALDRIAFAATLLGDRRARTWTAAAWAIRNATGDLQQLRETGELQKIRGVGRSTLQVIDQVFAGEAPTALARFERELPAGLFEIRRVKGLGPKKVKRLWQELQITTLGELEHACQENRLARLTGFGAKTQQRVLAELERLRSVQGAMRRDQARKILEPLEHALWVAPEVSQVAVVGDFARGVELVREIAVLVETTDEAAAAAQLRRAIPEAVSVALYFAGRDEFAAVQVWRSSSDGHRRALRERAEARGLTFDAQGLLDRTGRAVECEEEGDVYRALGLVPTARERRQDDVPLVTEGRARPRLVRREDLRGALHNHSVASDGDATLTEMRAAAAAWGLSYLGISDHSQSAGYAGGLEPDRLLEQLGEIARLNQEPASPCVLLSGVESDILREGELDYQDDLLARLDVVVASVHQRTARDPQEMTARMVTAASQRYADIIGHPTGRLLLAREATEYDVGAFLDTCATHRVAVELNGNPHRLDLNERHLRMAKDRGLLISIAADAHATRELDHLDYGLTIARRAGLTPDDVLNTRSLTELRAWISRRRA